MYKICLEKLVQSYAKVKRTPNNTIARTHYIKFLRAEDKFMKATETFEKDMGNWSLKSIPDFFVSFKHFGKMCAEKLKSAYYFKK